MGKSTLRRFLWTLLALVPGCNPVPGPPSIGPPPAPSGGTLPGKDGFRVQVTFQTSQGDFVIELFSELVPITVENFLLYVREGFYTNTIFHRVIKGQYCVGGGYDTEANLKEPLADPIGLEALLTNAAGTVAMARQASSTNSATSHLIFNVADNAALFDKRSDAPQFAGHAVFGRVIEGLDILEQIGEVPTSVRDDFTNRPTTDVIINAVTVSAEPGGPEIDLGDETALDTNEDTTDALVALNAIGLAPETFTWSVSTDPKFGTTVVNGSGASVNVAYTPRPDFFGTDTFVVQVEDARGRNDSITVQVTISNVPEDANPRVRFRIENFGEFVVELFPDITPITVDNFLQYVDDGFYNGKIWHRVIADFVIQTGRFSQPPNGVIVADDVRAEIPGEADGAPSNVRGTVSMALRGGEPDSGSEGFFISVIDNTNLDWDGSFGHTVFGEVVEGLEEVVDAISLVETGPAPSEVGGTFQDVPTDPVVITEIVRE